MRSAQTILKIGKSIILTTAVFVVTVVAVLTVQWHETFKFQGDTSRNIQTSVLIASYKQQVLELAGPPNTLFETHNLAKERKAFNQVKHLPKQTLNQLSSIVSTELEIYEAIIEINALEMQLLTKAENVFTEYENQRLNEAAKQMALMDQTVGLLNRKMHQVEIAWAKKLITNNAQFNKSLAKTFLLIGATGIFLLIISFIFLLMTRKSKIIAEFYEKESSRLMNLNDSYRTMMDFSGIVSMATPEGTITYVNDTFCEVSGYSRDELIGHNHRIVNSRLHDEAFWKGFWRILKSGNIWRGEICNRNKNGDLYWVDTTIMPIFDKNSKDIIEYFSFRRVITEEKNNAKILDSLQKIHNGYFHFLDQHDFYDFLLEEVLKISESEYGFIGEILQNHEGQPYLKTYAITNIAWNKETREFYEQNAPLGMEFHNLNSLFGHAMKTGKVYISNEPSTDPNRGGLPPGHPDLNHFLAIPLFAGATLIGLVGVANRKGGYSYNEVEKWRSLIDAISQLVDNTRKQKRIDSEKVKLVSQSKMATLGEMASGIAHEINNPLAIIKGYSATILKNLEAYGGAFKTEVEQLNKISTTTTRIARIINGLRAFARDGNSDPFTKTNAQEIIDDILPLCETRLKNNFIELTTLGSDSESEFECRSIQISQVLLNLIANSIDAIKGTENPWIKIEFSNTETHVRIRITDSGKGIPLDLANKIMNPFFTTKEIGKGTGLGLSISLGIIQSHRGTLNLDRTNSNTSFVVELPLKQIS